MYAQRTSNSSLSNSSSFSTAICCQELYFFLVRSIPGNFSFELLIYLMFFCLHNKFIKNWKIFSRNIKRGVVTPLASSLLIKKLVFLYELENSFINNLYFFFSVTFRSFWNRFTHTIPEFISIFFKDIFIYN